MANGQLKSKDVYQADLYADLVKSAEQANKILLDQKQHLTELQKLFNDLGVKSVADVKKLTAAEKEAKTISDANLKTQKAKGILDRELAKAKENLAKATSKENKELQRLRVETNQANKAARDNAKATLDQSNAYKKLTSDTNKAQAEFKRLAAQYGVNSKEARKARSEFDKFDKQLRDVNDAARDGRRDVGRYEKALGGLRKVLGALGITFAISELTRFGKELITTQNRLKGIEFAFSRLGLVGQKAFEDVRKSTRGLLADSSIKQALVEFDNFNISLEQSADLFEFLSVRAAQTGKSFDFLRDSLVEGLSKESKLRIDNLGISTADLNAELEKTPNFVQAVANIAKREIKEAGGVLDEAANSQQRFNTKLENGKDALAKGLTPAFEAFFRVANFLLDNIRAIVTSITTATAAFAAYRVVVNATAIATNIASVATRAFNKVIRLNPIGLLITALSAVIPFFISYKDGANEAADAQDRLNKSAKDFKAISEGTQLVFDLSFENNLDLTSSTLEGLKDALASFSKPLPFGTDPEELKKRNLIVKRLQDEILKRENARKGLIEKIDESIAKKQEQQRKTRSKNEIKALEQEIKDLQEQKAKLLDIESETLEKIQSIKLLKQEETQELQLKSAVDYLTRLQNIFLDAFKNIEDAQRERLNKQINEYQEFAERVNNIISLISQNQARELDVQINQNSEALSAQEQRAQAGLQNELGFRRKQAAQLEEERERQAKATERRAKVLAYFNLFAENAKQNPDSAAAKSLAQVALAETLVGFFNEGTESIGDDTHTKWRNTGTDDYLAAVHKGERILTADQNKLVGGLSNEELAKLAFQYQNGMLQPNVSATVLDDSRIVNELKGVRQSVGNIKLDVHFDELGNAIISQVNGKIKKVIHEKTGGRFRP